jgi:hypothetical protein
VVKGADLAERINDEHLAAFGKAREALEHARRAGELLIEAKGKLAHGEWAAWLSENIKFSSRTATRYMQVAVGWALIGPKSDAMSDLTLTTALKMLNAPKELPKPMVNEDRSPAALLEAWDKASQHDRKKFVTMRREELRAAYKSGTATK